MGNHFSPHYFGNGVERSMEFVTLPNTDLSVSRICLGSWQFNNGKQSTDRTWQEQEFKISQEIVEKALDCGVNFIDTAEGYLNSEETLGRILGARRRDVVLASKFGWRVPDYTPHEIEVSIMKSLRLLQTDYLDIIQVHYPDHVSDKAACVAELKRQQALGRIRYYGTSNFGVNCLKEFTEAGGEPITNQVPYNLLWRAAEFNVLPYCATQGVSVLAYSPLQQGLLSGRYRTAADVPEGRRRCRLFHHDSTKLARHGQQGAEKELFQTIESIRNICEEAGVAMTNAALNWCLHRPEVKVVVVGSQSAEQVQQLVQQISLDKCVLERLTDATAELKSLLGDNVDQWAKDSRIV